MKMQKLLINAAVALVIIGLGITSLLYHDMYEKEQEKAIKREREVVRLQKVVEANERNTPQELIETSTKFIETMFAPDPNNPTANKKALLSLTTGEAHRRLTKTDKDVHTEDMSDLEGFESKAVINESVYNRIGSQDGKVIVSFEHWLTKDGVTDKTVNEATVTIHYVDGEWKVSEYKINQLL
jgi:Tfp pilus assembly protein FimV